MLPELLPGRPAIFDMSRRRQQFPKYQFAQSRRFQRLYYFRESNQIIAGKLSQTSNMIRMGMGQQNDIHALRPNSVLCKLAGNLLFRQERNGIQQTVQLEKRAFSKYVHGITGVI